MVSVNDYLNGLYFNGQNLGELSGDLNATAGGFTQVNAPMIYASLLQALAAPGGPLSSLATDRAFAGQVQGITSAGQQAKTSAAQQLSTQGVNAGQAAVQLAGLEEQLIQALGSARAAAEEQHGQEVQAATTELANVVASSESTQKQREEQVRQFEALKAEMEKQNKFNRTLGLVNLGLTMFPGIGKALGQGLGQLFGDDTLVGSAFTGNFGENTAQMTAGAPAGGPAGTQAAIQSSAPPVSLPVGGSPRNPFGSGFSATPPIGAVPGMSPFNWLNPFGMFMMNPFGGPFTGPVTEQF